MTAADTFPRHSARTQGFTLGAPRNFTVSPDGRRVLFLRSASGTDRSNALWMLTTEDGTEHLVADPARLDEVDAASPEELARRERARERASGITEYTVDATVSTTAFALSGSLFVVDADTGQVTRLPAQRPAADPRLSPNGDRIAYTTNGALRVIGSDGLGDCPVAEPEHERERWGTAEFIAAEEMNRGRGYWWAPDGSAILAARVDESEVARWNLADPAEPAQSPNTMPYPAAGEANADVALELFGLTGTRVTRRTSVSWDRDAHPYLVAVHWSEHGAPLLAVQSRDQRSQPVLALDPGTGGTHELHRETDHNWVEIKSGWPAWTPGGSLVRISPVEGAYRLLVDGEDRTGAELQVRAVLDIDETDILVAASEADPSQVHVYRVGELGVERRTETPGVHGAARGGPVTVLSSAGLEELRTRVRVLRDDAPVTEIASHAEDCSLVPRVELLRLGARELSSALLLPRDHDPGHGRLPVLLDPYGGPQAQRVLHRRHGYLTSQWFADQGFAVLITDGRGTGGRGPDWDRAIAGDVAGPALQDQVDALHACASERTDLDLNRVAIRGWSFGGYLAALAVLRRPDVFHTAIAGAPVCDWRLYDTHYTERYLGDPNTSPETYAANSLLSDAGDLNGHLLLIHGTVDDNVVFAHSLRMSEALTAAGKSHTLLPLPGVSHMPTSESKTENLLLLQLDFLRRTLSPNNPTTA
ncbi:dipeptidyl-peptidase-4 [Actinopolyspora biskrensis]|uniref:Dipeptidyl-peptidase-4 n=1 Tax=Actinopolyspora biskrensis TaxID=1470178 RepID=A0A852ZBW9_9ACTN|nr:prolyl oligopeptidase family serine peptidase [Actinopolyspora biskrensis]NYH81006.1 dipeptidyl-peptidase-4 [Actinopolyspora biskrensis]